MNKFIKFLVEAKKNTYALNGETNEKILRDGSKELSFERDNFYYRDRYFGSESFAGEEVVFDSQKPFWVMNYSGKCLNDICDKKEIFTFLKKCLKRVSQKTIFRGPKEFKQGDFLYINKIQGKVEDFYGEEYIYYQGKKVYKLKYHGGIIKYK